MSKKTYKVYRLKYGLNKYSIETALSNGRDYIVLGFYRDATKLALQEFILQGEGYVKQGETEEKLPTIVTMEEDEETDIEE